MEVLQSVTEVQQRLRALCRPHFVPDHNIIFNTHRKPMETGSVLKRPRSGRPRRGQSEENVAAAREAFDLNQGKSIQRISSELNIQRILRRNHRLFPYKIKVVQKLDL